MISKITFSILFFASFALSAFAEQPVIRLWPIEMVGGEKNRFKEVYRDRKGKKQLCGVLDPNLTVYQVKSDKPTPALIYCPGGAYKILGLPSREVIQKWHDLGGLCSS